MEAGPSRLYPGLRVMGDSLHAVAVVCESAGTSPLPGASSVE